MRSIWICLALAALSTTAVRAEAAQKIAEGCPVTTATAYDGKGGVSIQFALKNFKWPIALHPTMIRVGGWIEYLTPQQAAAYGPIIATFNAAAQANRKVLVYYDEKTKAVQELNVKWDRPC